MKSTLKDSLRRLAINGVVDSPLPAPATYDHIITPVNSVNYAPPSSAGSLGIASPLTMVITATVARSIPVPTGATAVDVLDAAAYTLTDANGVVYTISSVTWP